MTFNSSQLQYRICFDVLSDVDVVVIALVTISIEEVDVEDVVVP